MYTILYDLGGNIKITLKSHSGIFYLSQSLFMVFFQSGQSPLVPYIPRSRHSKKEDFGGKKTPLCLVYYGLHKKENATSKLEQLTNIPGAIGGMF